MNTTDQAPDEQIIAAVTQPISQIETICSTHGRSFAFPAFSKISEKFGLGLRDKGWVSGDDADVENAIRIQSIIRALSQQSGYKLSSQALSFIAKQSDNHFAKISSEKFKNWEIYEADTYVVKDFEGLLVFIKYRKLDFGYFEFTIFVGFPESCRALFHEKISSSILSSVFDQHFRNETHVGPFDTIIEAENKFGGRDRSSVKLVAKSVYTHNLSKLSEENLMLPSAFVQLDMMMSMM